MENYFEPWVVVGPGRSGTSFVARVLHERLGVCMGERFNSDKTNPRGFYEDCDFKDANQALLTNVVSEHGWRTMVEPIIHARRQKGRPWGFKDPRVAEPQIASLLRPYVHLTRVIRCKRSRNDVIRSMCLCYGWTIDDAGKVYDRRERTLDRLDYGASVLVIDIDNNPSEDDVVFALKKQVCYD